MDHTRASVLSVCTAAIIGAGASAGGLEEGAGAGGPADWIECGVRKTDGQTATDLFGFTDEDGVFEFLTPEPLGNGAYLISMVRLRVEEEALQSSKNEIGI